MNRGWGDIGKDYSLNIQNMRKIYLLGFSIRLWDKSFLLVRYTQNMIGGCLSLGATPPISFWAQIYFFLADVHLCDITYLSEGLNCFKNACQWFQLNNF